MGIHLGTVTTFLTIALVIASCGADNHTVLDQATTPDLKVVVHEGGAVTDTKSLELEASEFFLGLAHDFNTGSDLYWSFMFEGATLENAETLASMLREQGFSEVEIFATEEIDPDDIDNAHLGLFVRERKTHTVETFVHRVVACQGFADKNGLEMVDFTAGIE
jgi:hypothetical protein